MCKVSSNNSATCYCSALHWSLISALEGAGGEGGRTAELQSAQPLTSISQKSGGGRSSEIKTN